MEREALASARSNPKLQIRQRRPRASIAGFRCEEFDSNTIICDDNSFNDGEKYQQLLEAFHAGNERLEGYR